MSGRKDQGRPKTRSESSGLRLSAANVPRPLGEAGEACQASEAVWPSGSVSAGFDFLPSL
jgi:hypothetical protein